MCHLLRLNWNKLIFANHENQFPPNTFISGNYENKFPRFRCCFVCLFFFWNPENFILRKFLITWIWNYYTVAFSDNPAFSDNNKEEPKLKEELEAKYQRVTDSKSKLKSAIWRTISQVLRYRLMVHYKFLHWQTNWRYLFGNKSTIFYKNQ